MAGLAMDCAIGAARPRGQQSLSDAGDGERSTQYTTERATASRLFSLHHTKDGDGVCNPHQVVTLRVVHEHMQILWRVRQSKNAALLPKKQVQSSLLSGGVSR